MTDETTTGARTVRPTLTRRHALAGAAIAGVAVPTLAACGSDDTGTEAGTPTSSAPSSEAPASSSAPESSSAAGGSGFATTADVPEGSGAIFADEKIVVTQPTAGDFKGFSNICTHQGCPVADVTDTINCKCHGSKFSIEDGSVTQGPATEPLAAMEITVSGDAISMA